MSLLADYDPDPAARLARIDARIRLARPADAPAIARLSAERNGLDAAEIEPRIAADLGAITDAGDYFVFVAEPDATFAGYARLRHLERAPDARPNAVPTGWYLTGIVVAPAWRRRGIATALTRARIDWAAHRTDRLLYFTSTANLASIALHAALGFRHVATNVSAPNVTFSSGPGILFERPLP